MKAVHFNVNFFFLLLSGVGIMMFFILQPFLTAILAAAILAALFQGWYTSILKKTGNRTHLSSLLTLLAIALIIIGPLFAIFSVAINESNIAYERMTAGDGSGQISITTFLDKAQSLPFIHTLLGGQTLDSTHIITSLKGFSDTIISFVQVLYQGVIHFVFWLFVMFFSLFYFFIDGKRMVRYAMSVMPLRDEHEKLLIDKFVSMSRATLRGTLIVAIVQGFLGGIVFAVAGVPSPVILGLIMAVMSIIPLVGVGAVWLPVGLVLLFMGQVWQGVFVLMLGASVISTVDNLLQPKLIGHDTQMHPLLIFFATLGGLAFFGVPGFVLGPIIASLALALLDIYTLEFKTQLKAYNE